MLKNRGLANADLLGLSTFWDVVSTLPFFGTLYNIIVSPAGAKVSDYTIVIDSSMCELDPAQAVEDCKNNVGTQQASYIANYAALNILHEVLDGFGSIAPWAPAFWIDSAVDFFVSLYKTSRIIVAADSAKLKCVCPSCPTNK